MVIKRKSQKSGYRSVFDVGYKIIPGCVCVYCGDAATGYDHVPPLSCCKGSGLLYPCCRECNCMLCAYCSDDLEKRKIELKRRLKRKYKKILNMPVWEEHELGEVDFSMKKYIETSENIKISIIRRINYDF